MGTGKAQCTLFDLIGKRCLRCSQNSCRILNNLKGASSGMGGKLKPKWKPKLNKKIQFFFLEPVIRRNTKALA